MAFSKVLSVVVLGLAVAVIAHGFGEGQRFEGREREYHGFDLIHQLRQNLTVDQRAQVDAVLNNTALTKAQVESQLQSLFNNFGLSTQFQTALNHFNSFIANLTTIEAQITANLTSSTAKDLADKTLALIKNQNLTFDQQRNQTEALWKAASSSDREQLEKALRVLLAEKTWRF